jgi:hypothetical protein
VNRLIKFSYIQQHAATGRFSENVLSLEHIEEINGGLAYRGYTIIARRRFTGLLDKNGKEIYEGDVVRWADTPKIKLQWAVEYADGGAMFFAKCLSGGGCTLHGLVAQGPIEITGNIYENHELLPR